MLWTEQEELMLEQYAGVKSVDYISAAIGRPRGAITQKASNMGISLSLKNSGVNRGPKNKIPQKVIDEVRALLGKGLSYKKISDITGVSKPYVAQIKHGKGARFKSDKNTIQSRTADFNKAFSIMSVGSHENRI